MLRSGFLCAQVPHFNLYNPALPPRATLQHPGVSPPPPPSRVLAVARDPGRPPVIQAQSAIFGWFEYVCML